MFKIDFDVSGFPDSSLFLVTGNVPSIFICMIRMVENRSRRLNERHAVDVVNVPWPTGFPPLNYKIPPAVRRRRRTVLPTRRTRLMVLRQLFVVGRQRQSYPSCRPQTTSRSRDPHPNSWRPPSMWVIMRDHQCRLNCCHPRKDPSTHSPSIPLQIERHLTRALLFNKLLTLQYFQIPTL